LRSRADSRFFREGSEQTTLVLEDVKATSTGVVVLTYRSASGGAAGSSAASER
jgi:hypothetical protein